MLPYRFSNDMALVDGAYANSSTRESNVNIEAVELPYSFIETIIGKACSHV